MPLVPCLPCSFTNNGRYMPIVLNEFEKLGILDDLLARSLRNTDGIYFRTPFAKGHQHLGTLSVAKLPKGVMKYDFVATNLGQHELGKLLLEHAEELETFEISWNHRFAGVITAGCKWHKSLCRHSHWREVFSSRLCCWVRWCGVQCSKGIVPSV